MIKVPCKITLSGDEDYARNFIGAGQSQLRILEDELSSRGLVRGTRKTRLDSRTTTKSIIVNQFQEVKIYSQPLKKEAEELEEGLAEGGRFFAKVRRGGFYGEVKFYWIIFTKDSEGDVRITVASTGSSKNILNRMSATPHTTARNTHSFTKSFMIKNGDDIEERWIAAPHLLVREGDEEGKKTHTEVFNPLGYPYAQDNLMGGTLRYYPLPPFCIGLGATGTEHACPPNRFYCNTDERKMVWYSCCTAIDTTFPTVPVIIHYCFGIILTLTDNMISEKYYSPLGIEYQRIIDSSSEKELIKTFNCDSSEADGEGFEPLWYYVKPDPDCTFPDPDPMCGADADVPYQMLLDVNSLDENTLEVFVPWSERPTKFTIDLTSPDVVTTASDHTCEAVDETQHWYWTEDGFEQEKFVNLEYNANESGTAKYSDNPFSMGSVECNATAVIYWPIGSSPPADVRYAASVGCTGGCPGLFGKLTETFQGAWEKSCYRSPGMGKTHKETIYDIFLPGNTVNMTSRDWEIVTTQGKCNETEHCLAEWSHTENVWIGGVLVAKWELDCTGPIEGGIASIRYIGETLIQKLADSVSADWCSPNVVFVGSTKDRVFVDAFEEMGRLTHDHSTVSGEDIQYVGTTEYAQQPADRYFADSYWGEGSSGIDPCGGGLPISSFMPYQGVNLWGVPVDLEEFSSMSSISSYGTTDCFLPVFIDNQYSRKKTSNKNTFDEPLVLQYQVDGEGSFSSQSFNRTYYLDDRSSIDNEGLLVAARGAVVADYASSGDPIFDVARWGAVYKFPGESSFIEVINELLEVLNCDASELIELGLI